MKAGQKSLGSASSAALTPEPDEGVGGAAATVTSSATAVQNCGS